MPANESPEIKPLSFDQNEQELLFNTLKRPLIEYTGYQIRGILSEQLADDMNAARRIALRLIDNLNIKDQLDSYDLVRLGLVDLLSDEELTQSQSKYAGDRLAEEKINFFTKLRQRQTTPQPSTND